MGSAAFLGSFSVQGDGIMKIGFFMINKLHFSNFSPEDFRKKYRVFHVTSLLDYSVPDDIEKHIIYSIAYEATNDFYCLVPSDVLLEDLGSVFRDYKFSVEECRAMNVPEYILINLFINKFSNRNLSFNNFNASLYLIYDTERIDVIPTLKFEVDSDCILSCDVNSFSRWDETTSKRFTYKQQKNFNSGKSTIYRVHDIFMIKGKGKDIYLQANINRKKNNTLNYLDLSSDYHKLGKTSQVIKGVNLLDQEVFELAFEDCGYTRIMEAKKENLFSNIINSLPYKETVNVVNNTCNELNEKDFADSGIEFSYSNGIKKDMFNLNVVEQKDYYETNDKEDQYLQASDITIQNIEFDHICRSSLRQCYLELCVKKEAAECQTRIHDFSGDWSFVQLINNIPYRMSIVDNEIQDDLSSLDIDDRYYSIFYDENNNLRSDNPKIVEHDGNYLIIRDTDVRLMPDYEKYANAKYTLFSVSESGKKKQTLQKKAVRDVYYGEIIDVNEFTYNGNDYYTVGNIGYGVRREFNNSVSTKRIESHGLTVSEVKEMLKPNVYQINRYAVYPYPFKLMKERFIQLGGNIDETV